eukprot:TRINITY_DN1554_c0_g1_i2.p1 TRINITY_DN1554_c0_g1~~TRINITY_DN1554_c0_g1_i2.p1  ORF type:complete len:810 (+),score=135.68 TRINITY_DN1554_c0_g1_i2:173-2602(+)
MWPLCCSFRKASAGQLYCWWPLLLSICSAVRETRFDRTQTARDRLGDDNHKLGTHFSSFAKWATLGHFSAETYSLQRLLPGLVAAAIILVIAALIYFLVTRCSGSQSTSTEEAAAATGPSSPGAAQNEPSSVPESQLSSLKKQKTKLLFEQAMQKQRLEKTIQMILEIERSSSMKPSAEEVRKKADEAIDAADVQINNRLLSAVAYVAPMAMQGQRITAALDERMKAAQEKAMRAALDETKNLARDMQSIFQVNEIHDQLFQSLSKFETGSVATLLASMMAPTQLRWLYFTNEVSAYQLFFFCLVSAIVLSFDLVQEEGGSISCPSHYFGRTYQGHVDLWYKIDLSVCLFCLLVRMWVLRTVGNLMVDLTDPPAVDLQEDPIRALRNLLDYHVNQGGEALMKVDVVLNSWIYGLSNFCIIFQFIWGVCGIELVLSTLWSECPICGLIILRVRVFLFTVLIIPSLITVALWFVGRFMTGEDAQVQLVMFAHSIDEQLDIGFPLISVLTQSMFVRKKRDMYLIQLRMFELKKANLEKQRAQAAAELEKMTAEAEKHGAMVTQLKGSYDSATIASDDEVQRQRDEEREKLLAEAETIFKLVNEKAKLASADAEEQVKKWEAGEGGELLEAVAKGEGLQKLQVMISEIDVQAHAENALATAEALSEQLAKEEWVQQAKARGEETLAAVQTSATVMADKAMEDESFRQAVAVGQAHIAQSQVALEAAMKSEAVQQSISRGQTLLEEAMKDELDQEAMSTGQAQLARGRASLQAVLGEAKKDESGPQGSAGSEQSQVQQAMRAESVQQAPKDTNL